MTGLDALREMFALTPRQSECLLAILAYRRPAMQIGSMFPRTVWGVF